MGENGGKGIFFACLKSKANSLDHGASDGMALGLHVRFHGFFELAVGFFHGHGNVDRSFLTFRARLTIIFFFFQRPCKGGRPFSDNNSCVTRQNF